MIPNQWYAILESKSLKKKPVGLTRMGERIVLWRDGEGRAVCMPDRCPHRGTSLSLGKVVDGALACRYHGLRYDCSGQCVRVPAHGEGYRIPKSLKTKTHTVREQNGLIWLWWGDERAELPEIPWLDDIPADPKECVTKCAVWPFNYARITENQFDVQHWAFLHGNIMFGVGDYFESFHCKVEGEAIHTWGNLRRGGRRKGDKNLWPWRVSLRFPNLSMIEVSPRFRSLAIATPIDDNTSWMYIRSFQNFSRTFPIRQMIDAYCIHFLYTVPLYRQDFPVWQSQKPWYTDVGVYKLVPCDEGIAKYLSMRRQMIDRAKAEREAAAATERVKANGNGNRTRPSLPVVLTPDAERNAHIGTEPPLVQKKIWAKAMLAYPLLIPSLIIGRTMGKTGDSNN